MRFETRPGPAVLFSFVTIAFCLACYEALDVPVARFFAAADYRIKHIFELITWLGLSWPYLAAASAGFIYFKLIKKDEPLANAAAFLFTAVALSGLANDLIKVLVGRSRPGLLFSEGIYVFKPFTDQYLYASFPSGHSNTIAALGYGLSVVTGRFKYIWLTIALSVMASRVVVEAHFLSDVIFGAYLGIVVTGLVAVVFEKTGFRVTRKHSGQESRAGLRRPESKAAGRECADSQPGNRDPGHKLNERGP
jgi:membrane-associated phospholipid phosphatase